MYNDKPYVCPRRSKPSVGMPSGLHIGQKHASAVDASSASDPAASSTGAGVEVQNHFSPARAEKSVRKSETDTWEGRDRMRERGGIGCVRGEGSDA